MNPVLVDASFIVARMDRRQEHHALCLNSLDGLEGPLITCEAVIAEACHLLRRFPGTTEALLENIATGNLQIPLTLASRAREITLLLKKNADVPMDLADACLVDLATQVGSGRILTLDSEFKIYRGGRNRAFELLIDLD